MDRLQLRTKFASRIEEFRLDEFDLTVHLRPLSAMERAKIVDKHKRFQKLDKESDTALETLTVESQCFIVARGLVDEKGARVYKDDEAAAIADEIPCKALDKISGRILEISGMASKEATELKNAPQSPSGDSSEGSQPVSEGRTSESS